ncbi:uncharacterized protein LOC124651314 [Lolium rigidum]|uniref:uncharacterized protein LOC124651314 n=1 Tax=Lolium rigidum TaxID=89674 RepID=UPI001F5D1333|nr:uncharacterized protein LOC124651314 [Lolium rigidum]
MADEGRLVAGSGELIRPPRLEDAGLEDCALPPESIAEAFSLAAMAVSSRFPRLSLSDDEDEDDERDAPLATRGGCVEDAGPTCGAIPDALVGAGGAREGGADEVVVVGGGGGEGGSDEVVVVGRGDEEDRVVVVGEELQKKLGQEKGCVEGIRKEEERKKKEEEDIAEKAILVEDFA